MKHEIELKALLTAQKHKELIEKLSSELKIINEDSIHTTRYRPGDIRLRFSKKMFEIVEKHGDPTNISRKEKVTTLNSKEELEAKKQELEEKGFKADPSWIKHKKEFIYPYQGYEYLICLQDIDNFARIIEVEFLSEEDNTDIHEPNIRAIMKELNVEAIDPKDFKERIQEYIETNK